MEYPVAEDKHKKSILYLLVSFLYFSGLSSNTSKCVNIAFMRPGLSGKVLLKLVFPIRINF